MNVKSILSSYVFVSLLGSYSFGSLIKTEKPSQNNIQTASCCFHTGVLEYSVSYDYMSRGTCKKRIYQSYKTFSVGIQERKKKEVSRERETESV